jgi:hypothetical protein
MELSRSLPVLALSIAGALLFAGCAANPGSAQSPSSAAASGSAKPLTALQIVQKADPDNLGKGLTYTAMSENSDGKYVELGADKKSYLAKYDAKLWTKTGSSWTEKDMAAAQLAAVNFVYGHLFSGPALGGDKADTDKQVTRLTKTFSKWDQDAGIGEILKGLYQKPVSQNPFLAWSDPVVSNFTGFDFYQSKDSSRFLNATVKLKTANSYDKGDISDSTKAEIDGASVTVVAAFDWKFTQNKKTYVKPTEIEYDVYFIKDKVEVGIHGANLERGEVDAAPKATKF